MIEDQGAAIYGWLVQGGSIRNFSLKRPFYLDSAKIHLVKMIFHVLFRVLETIERRR